MSKKICLDAGHVGSKYNQSPVVKTYYESAMVWALHLKLKAQLEARGFQVVTTRASIDTDLGVYERGTASKGCDVFISLHSNACGTESVDYPVVYRAYDNKNNVDTLALKLAKKVGELMGTTQAGRTATRKNSSGGEYYGVLRGARAVGTPLYLLIGRSGRPTTCSSSTASTQTRRRRSGSPRTPTWTSWPSPRLTSWRSSSGWRAPPKPRRQQSWARPRPPRRRWPRSA